jgi:uncharacterized membrane protein YphA (DoxX/SURF4 family)
MRRWLLRRLSHLLVAGIFVSGGADAFRDPGPRAAKAGDLGLPYPETMTRLNGAAMVVTGAALGLGLARRWAARVLMASLVPTTVAGHPFWKEGDPKARAMQRTQFMKNLGLLGALVGIEAYEG